MHDMCCILSAHCTVMYLTIHDTCSVVPQMYGGMRGIRGLVTETSLLDPEEVCLHDNIYTPTPYDISFAGHPFPWLQYP